MFLRMKFTEDIAFARAMALIVCGPDWAWIARQLLEGKLPTSEIARRLPGGEAGAGGVYFNTLAADEGAIVVGEGAIVVAQTEPPTFFTELFTRRGGLAEVREWLSSLLPMIQESTRVDLDVTVNCDLWCEIRSLLKRWDGRLEVIKSFPERLMLSGNASEIARFLTEVLATSGST